MAPVGTLDRSPPLGSGNTTGRWKIIGQEAGEDEGPSVGFGQGDETGAFDECANSALVTGARPMANAGTSTLRTGPSRWPGSGHRRFPSGTIPPGSQPHRNRARTRTNRPWGTDGSSWGNVARAGASNRASSLAHPDSGQEACAIAERARSSATRLRPMIAWSEEAGVGRSDSDSPPQKPSSRLVRA